MYFQYVYSVDVNVLECTLLEFVAVSWLGLESTHSVVTQTGSG